jgi:hypothetical protein
MFILPVRPLFLFPGTWDILGRSRCRWMQPIHIYVYIDDNTYRHTLLVSLLSVFSTSMTDLCSSMLGLTVCNEAHA